MKKRKIILIVVGAFIILVAVGVFVAQRAIQSNLSQLDNVAVNDVPLAQVKDGTYNGHFAAFPVTVDVAVTVLDHKYKEIKLVKHDNGQGKPAEAITGKVIQAQSLKVDLVSGATYSSKVILKAIEDAVN